MVIDVASPRRVHWRMRRARSQYEWRQFGWIVMAFDVFSGLSGVRLVSYVTLPVAGWSFALGNYVIIACQTCVTPT